MIKRSVGGFLRENKKGIFEIVFLFEINVANKRRDLFICFGHFFMI